MKHTQKKHAVSSDSFVLFLFLRKDKDRRSFATKALYILRSLFFKFIIYLFFYHLSNSVWGAVNNDSVLGSCGWVSTVLSLNDKKTARCETCEPEWLIWVKICSKGRKGLRGKAHHGKLQRNLKKCSFHGTGSHELGGRVYHCTRYTDQMGTVLSFVNYWTSPIVF